MRGHAFCLGAVILAALSAAAQAAPIVTGLSAAFPTTNNAVMDTYGPDILSNDLINDGSPTLSSWARDKTPFFETTTLNDALGSGGALNMTRGTYLPATFAGGVLPITYTFNLDTSVNTLGYDVSSIVSYAGWNDNGSHLADQKYELQFSQVGDAGFVSKGVFQYIPFGSSDVNRASATKMTLSDLAAPLGSGVDAVRFILMDHGVNNVTTIDGTVYFEIDVNGSATQAVTENAVPEPATLALIASGLAGLGGYLRRRK